jgi:hypothetical protein
MSITTTCTDTILINGTDVQTWCAITNADGLLSNAPQRADIIEQDWTAGAIYQAGPKKTYTFDVPVIMRSSQQDVALGQLRALQAYVGTQVTLTRRLVVNGATVNETCQAVMVNAVQVQWDFARRAQVRAVLVFQQLSGVWA